MYTILICDDDRDIVSALDIYLTSEGYRTIAAYNGREAIQAAEENEIHLILMDVMMPELDGIRATAKLREGSNVPIILLTAKSEDTDKILGLNIGADDYITKPFNGDELILRLTNILRRVYRDEDDILNLGDRQINWGSGQITGPEGEISLTAKEYAILKKLAENRGRIVTIDGLCDAVWKDGNFGHENALMVYIRRLREKLEDNPSKPKWIITSRGLGYKLAKE